MKLKKSPVAMNILPKEILGKLLMTKDIRITGMGLNDCSVGDMKITKAA